MKFMISCLRHSRSIFLLIILPASFHAAPMLRLEGPLVANTGETWTVSVFVDGVGSEAPGEELLAFGYNVGFPSHGLGISGVTVAVPFADDTALLGGPFAGSVFPGLQGSSILLGSISFNALQEGTYTVSVRDQIDRPDITGLFTTAGRYPIEAYAEVIVRVPDASSTFCLLATGLCSAMLVYLRIKTTNATAAGRGC